MGKKYVCCAGYVVSKTDNQRHLIKSSVLPRLYKVNPKDCFFCGINENIDDILIGVIDKKELNYLTPRNDGNYQL